MDKSIILKAKYIDNTENVPLHSHDCHQIIFLKEGSVKVEINGVGYHITAPAVILICPMEQHAVLLSGDRYCRYVIYISPDIDMSEMAGCPILPFSFESLDGLSRVVNLPPSYHTNVLEDVLKTIVLEQNSEQPYANQRSNFLYYEFLILLYRIHPTMFLSNEKKREAFIGTLQKYIDNHYSQDITIEFLSEKFYFSPSFISRKFRDMTGYSVYQYLLLRRLNAAKNLLAKTDSNIIEVALNVGFADVSNFSRFFKKRTGYTPSQYRKLHKQADDSGSSKK